MSLHFDQPAWLWLGLIGLPMTAAGIAWFNSMSRLRRWTCIAARLALVATIVGMLAGATAVRTTSARATIVILDRSGSVDSYFDLPPAANPPIAQAASSAFLEAARQSLRLALAASDRAPDDRVGIVLLGAQPTAWSAPTRADPFPEPIEAPVSGTSDIAGAIRLARAMIPADATGRIVLLTDGNQTTGDALAEARLAAAAGTPIDAVPLRYAVASEVTIESVDAPTVAAPGTAVVVRVTLQSAGPATGTLELLNNGSPVDISPGEQMTGRRLTLTGPAVGSNGRQIELIETVLPQGRVHRFEAVFTPDLKDPARPQLGYAADRVAANNRAQAATFSSAPGAILLIDGVGGGNSSGPGATLRDTLESAGLQVSMISPEAAPRDLIGFETFDLVLLANVAADSVDPGSVTALAHYVTDLAGGLVMIGGPQSFGAGGWKGTSIEPLLPVVLDLPEQLIKPSAAIVLVLDNSGSMSTAVMGSRLTQQEIANEGAALAIESMDRTDLLGVITFNSFHTIEVPLGRLRDPAAAAARVRSIRADGGTFCGPALAEAGRMLAGVDADVRHIVVLSDGRSKGADELPELAARIARDGIRVSTIAVGTRADAQTMAEMATKGNGRFYRVIDPTILPRILLKAVRVVRSPLIREGDFQPVILATGSPLTQNLPAGMPPLGGLVLTQARDVPTVTYAMSTPAGEPVLAHWNAGLGRVAAFTSDAHEWSARWVDWPGYSQMWTSIARTVSRPPSDRRQELAMTIDGDLLRLRLDATDASNAPLDLLSVPGAVYTPDGRRIEVRLAQTAPGRYEASISPDILGANEDGAEAGTYIATLSPRRPGRDGFALPPLPPVISAISRSAGVEYAALKSNDGLVEGIARASGGRVIEFASLPTTNLFDRTAVRPSESRSPLWPLLLIWSVGLMLLDVGTRRIAWDRLLSREFGSSLRRDATVAMRPRGDQAAAAADSLRRTEPARAPQVVRPSAGQLGDEDAVALVREQAERRRQARREQTPGPAQGPGPPLDDSGLLAAKRRAKRKIDEQREDDRP